jgi:hypothetical protein
LKSLSLSNLSLSLSLCVCLLLMVNAVTSHTFFLQIEARGCSSRARHDSPRWVRPGPLPLPLFSQSYALCVMDMCVCVYLCMTVGNTVCVCVLKKRERGGDESVFIPLPTTHFPSLPLSLPLSPARLQMCIRTSRAEWLWENYASEM